MVKTNLHSGVCLFSQMLIQYSVFFPYFSHTASRTLSAIVVQYSLLQSWRYKTQSFLYMRPKCQLRGVTTWIYCETPFPLGRKGRVSQNGPRLAGVGWSPGLWSNWTGFLLSAELYRRVKQPLSRWVGQRNDTVSTSQVLWDRMMDDGMWRLMMELFLADFN
jgi:hypothetical protein